jgi:hypothetical protein
MLYVVEINAQDENFRRIFIDPKAIPTRITRCSEHGQPVLKNGECVQRGCDAVIKRPRVMLCDLWVVCTLPALRMEKCVGVMEVVMLRIRQSDCISD